MFQSYILNGCDPKIAPFVYHLPGKKKSNITKCDSTALFKFQMIFQN